uniref:Uncharacterized protein n=1 Tax=Candidatus Kentrum sp. MB TaxID=2138164 RepID=A0A450XGK4_9GAMM|nr:MAG: hypothetical protein BECKMB1821I_GA0114274_100626 [Candidatus Kentron sp. MB]VFK74223.1 MAG: hypothetical protein BECKMB1821H_GA0114242_100244 [Candidatus Kentron sp. MB]
MTMTILMAVVLLGAVGFLAYLALDAVRKAE